MFEALQKSEERYNLAIRGSIEGIWDWDIKEDSFYASPKLLEILEYHIESENLTLETFMDALQPADQGSLEEALNEHLDGGTSFDVECRLHRMNNEMRWLHIKGQAIWDSKGEAVRMAGSLIDITSRKRFETALQTFHEITTNSTLTFDEKVRKILILGTETFGLSIGVLSKIRQGTYTVMCVVDPDESMVQGQHFLLENTYCGYTISQDDIVALSDIGDSPLSDHPCYLNFNLQSHLAVPVKVGGEIYGTINFSGYTPHDGFNKQAQQIIKVFSTWVGQELEQLEVKEALEFKNQELREAKEIAEASSVSKTQFLANMSHEIRTPMNAIVGMAQLLTKSKLNKTQKKYMDVLVSSGDILLTLINDILDLAKVESGKLELERVAISPGEIAENVYSLYQERAKQKKISLSTVVEMDAETFVFADPIRVRQILNNFVSNAIKFTEAEGFITIKVEQTKADDQQVGCRFSVIDNGIGIPLSKQNLIFEEFSQADTSTTRNYGGTGLGLAICKRLVTLMGGVIGIESHPSRGTNIWIEVLLDRAEGAEDMVSAEDNAEIEKVGKPADDSLSVLLVEDNEFNQMVAQAMLKNLGHKVDVANNGKEGVEAENNKQYDVILMDVQMPIMDGIEATKAIHEKYRDLEKPSPPIIAQTAHAMSGDREKYLAAGMNEYISKPIDEDELRNVLKRITD